MAFVNGKSLSRCTKGDGLFGVMRQLEKKEDPALYIKKKKGKYKKSDWTEEKVKALASKLEAAQREIREMKNLIEEREKADEERRVKLIEMRKKAEEMNSAFAMK